PYHGIQRVSLVLEPLEARRRRDALFHESADPALVRGDRRELGAPLLDLFDPRAVAGLALRDLPVDVGGVLGESRLFDARDLLSGGDRLTLFGNGRRQPPL